LGGYIVVRQYAVYKANKFYRLQTEKNWYNKHDLVEIKLPIKMNGISGMDAYVPVNGQVSFADAAYNYVAMKVTANAIFLKCLPNYATTKLNIQYIIHAESLKDIPVPAKQHVPLGKFVFFHGFYPVFRNHVLKAPVITIEKIQAIYANTPVARNIDIPEQPPKFPC